MMKRLALAALAALALFSVTPASAQADTAKVVAACPAATPIYTAGQFGYPVIDVNGNACSSGGGGGGTNQVVIGPTADGSAATTAPVLTAGTVDGTGTGAVAIPKISAGGDQFANIDQFGGASVVTGTGAGGAGIPRFTISNDSSLAANQSVNLNQVAGATPSLTNPLFIAQAEAADVTGTFTNGTQTTSVTNSSADGYASGLVSINGTFGTATAVFERSDDAGTTWYAVMCQRSDGSANETGYSSLTNTNRQWTCPVSGNDGLRVRSTAVASGTVNVRVGISAPTANGGPANFAQITATNTNSVANVGGVNFSSSASAPGSSGFAPFATANYIYNPLSAIQNFSAQVVSPYQVGVTPITAHSGNVANAAAAATLTGTSTTTVFISSFTCTAGGSTTATEANITVTGLISGTETYNTGAPLGAGVPPTILRVAFNPPVPASAVNTNIVVSQPALGTGNLNASCNAEGFFE